MIKLKYTALSPIILACPGFSGDVANGDIITIPKSSYDLDCFRKEDYEVVNDAKKASEQKESKVKE